MRQIGGGVRQKNGEFYISIYQVLLVDTYRETRILLNPNPERIVFRELVGFIWASCLSAESNAPSKGKNGKGPTTMVEPCLVLHRQIP